MDTVAYQLAPKHCTIDLHSFCWVKYEIDSTIVEGKRLNLYTAAAKMTIHDNTTQVEVGFYPDLPGHGRVSSLFTLLIHRIQFSKPRKSMKYLFSIFVIDP